MTSLNAILPNTTDDFVFDNLGTGDLFDFSKVCRAAKLKVDSYIKRRFTIYRILDRFFDRTDSIEFRYLMRMTGMVLTGSSALQLFDRSYYEGSDLDMFVNRSEASVVGEWLQSRGYVFHLTEEQQNQSLTYEGLIKPEFQLKCGDRFTQFINNHFYDHFDVLNFNAKNPDRKVQIVLTKDCPLSVIMSFHSTVVLNIVTYSKAYCLYPQATLLQRRNLLNNFGSPSVCGPAIEKYTARGWTFFPFMLPRETLEPTTAFSTGIRRLGDKRCWTITFHPLDATNTELQTKYLTNKTENDIEFDRWMCGMDFDYHLINSAYIFHSQKLTRTYMFSTLFHRAEVIDTFSILKKKYKDEMFLDSHIPELYDMLVLGT